MNQIYNMLQGTESGWGTQATSKNIQGSDKSSRFEELLKSQAELGEEKQSKSRELFGQIALSQTGADISPEPFWCLNENMQVFSAAMGTGNLSKGVVQDEIKSSAKGTGIEERGTFFVREAKGAVEQEAHVRFPRMPGVESDGRAEDGAHSDEEGVAGKRLQRGAFAESKLLKSEKDLRQEEAVTEGEAGKGLHTQKIFMANADDSHKSEMKKVIKTTTSEAVPDIQKLSGSMLKNITKKAGEFEVWLHPENMGSLLVKAVYDEGQTVISLVSGESKVIQAILQNAEELADMLKLRLGEPVEVVADVSAFDYLEQENNHQKGQEHAGEQPEREAFQETEEEDSEKFLHQLRLGLM